MTASRYAASGMQAEFEPGSRKRVLRNLLGVVRVRDMHVIESDALAIVQESAPALYGGMRRFTASDIRELHRRWLGRIYSWAGEYRTVDVGKVAFSSHMRRVFRYSWMKSKAMSLGVVHLALAAIEQSSRRRWLRCMRS